ncbi:integrase core domain-containing protein [Providencia stuartii]
MLELIKPRRSTQNDFIKRFNRIFRTEILGFYLFKILTEADCMKITAAPECPPE